MSVSKRISPSLTMSSPARLWSAINVATASLYCSQYDKSLPIAVRNGRPRRFSVNQCGRGSDPVMVVASGGVRVVMAGCSFCVARRFP
jgi:hypothetical protein